MIAFEFSDIRTALDTLIAQSDWNEQVKVTLTGTLADDWATTHGSEFDEATYVITEPVGDIVNDLETVDSTIDPTPESEIVEIVRLPGARPGIPVADIITKRVTVTEDDGVYTATDHVTGCVTKGQDLDSALSALIETNELFNNGTEEAS